MLAQLYAWKVADLALLRRGEALPPLGPFLLFDVLVLRPAELVRPGAAAAGATEGARGGLAAQTGAEAGCKSRAAQDMSGGPEAADADGSSASGPAQPRVVRDGGLDTGRANGASHYCSGECGGTAGGECVRAAHGGSLGLNGIAVAVRAGAVGPPHAGGGLHGGCHAGAPRHTGHDRGHGGAQVNGCDSGAGKARTTGGRGAGGAVGTAVAPAGPWARLRLAVAAGAGPARDFAVCYVGCEALNAYLMSWPTEDVMAAPYLVKVGLSCCFAATLLLHLSYFFHSVEMLWCAAFAAAGRLGMAGRWAPLFNAPHAATGPADFWNKRWHQAFRWWWGRLVFVPLRAALKRALPPPLPPGEAHGGDGDGQHQGVQRCNQVGAPGRLRRRGRAGGGAARGHAANGSIQLRAVSGPRRPGPVSRWLSRHRGALLLGVPTLGVFAFSAAFHELLLWVNFGAPTGEQACFFMLHAALLLAEKAAERAWCIADTGPKAAVAHRRGLPPPSAPLRRAAFLAVAALSAPLFFAPWFHGGYHRQLRVLVCGPAGWAVERWVLGRGQGQLRLGRCAMGRPVGLVG